MTAVDIELLISDADLAAAARSVLKAEPGLGVVSESDLRPVHKGFRQFIDDSRFDICEIAVVTLLQAVAFDRPVVFLPVTILGRYQHQTLISARDLSVADLPGRTVGVRAWSQTTGVWVRGFLAHQYGVDLKSVRWRTYTRGHVPEHPEPTWVEPAEEGARLADDLIEGRVDFAMMGNDRPNDPRVRSVIDSPLAVAEEWARSVGYVPVNHVLAVRETTARAAAGAICALYDGLTAELAVQQNETGGMPMRPYGFAALRPAITAAAQFALEQELLPRPVTYDELVERTCAVLGVPAARLGGVAE